jgi:sugar phosphate isomerase/epimerase
VDPLVVSSYTLGVDVSFADRVRVAAGAGFAGIGLRAENYLAARAAGLTDADMLAVLDEHAIRVMEVEYLTGWGAEGDGDDAKERTVFHMARLFEVGHMNAGLLEKPPLPDVVTGFAALCRRAGDLVVALEFMPYSGVPDLGTAWEIVRAADRLNARLLVDAWHWTRAGMTPADLHPVPADRIVGIQLCDVGERPMKPLRQESLHHRLPPGRGYGDVVGMLRLLWAKRVEALISVEVISDELVAAGLPVAAATSMDAARVVLAASRG